MALGFGFNKQKVLASAEKAVQQGKLQNAIAEYEKITKEDPKDVTVLNTIGDLHARVGNNEKASVFFKKVGDIYAAEGFTVKAIAVYKKIAKLNPGAIECISKLAELYTQQGLYNDARSQYLLVADHFMKNSNLEDAAKTFQKILELDSENTAMQSKLADLYIKLGRKDDARNIYLTAAQSLYLKGALDAADESLRKVMGIDPENMEALLLRGRIAADAGDSASAVLYLEKIPDLDKKPEALKALLLAQLQTGKFDEAENLAKKLLTVHNDASGMSTFADALVGAGSVEAALRLYDQYSDKLLASNPASTAEKLKSCMSKITENPKALEMLRSIFVKAGEHAHVNEISEALAHACVQAGQLEKAASIYQELAQLEPENPLHVQNYKQIQAKLGKAVEVREMSKEEGAQALMVDELERPVPTLQQSYPDHIRDLVKAAVTEAELFESYNMAVKAIAPLEKALPEAPNDATINQRLASLYARTGRLQEAIERCQVLQKVYTEAGLAEQAAQYRDMAQKYAERADAAKKVAAVEYDASFMPGHEIGAPPHASAAAASPQAPSSEPAMSAPAMQEFSIDVTPPEPAAAPPAAPAPAAQHAHEIDLSDWEQMTQVEKPGEPLVDAAEVAEEAMFYIAQSLWNEAEDTIGKLRKMAPDSPAIADLQQKLGAAKAQASSVPAAASQQASVAEFTFEPEAPAPPPPVAAEPAAVEPPRPAAPPPPPPAPPKSQPAVAAAAAQPAPAAKGKDVLADFALDLDESLGADFAVSAAPAKSAPAPPPPAPAPVARATAPAAVAPAPAQKPAAPPAPVAPIAAHPDASSTLSDLFEEFKEGVEETADQAEDPDTHYNLGVAFKEMGLLDEAIGELQKVCHAIDKGHPFSQVMQAYTWLAHCFLEKGSPEASVKWYEKALKVPSIDEESKLAVYYELGAAYEAAGNKKAALQNFNEVYSSNIDYRDVADRIKALRS